MKKTYSELLRDPRWQKKRKEILCRDEYTCQACGETNSEIHVHHKYYKKELMPWEYPNESLITFCKDCHEIEHERIKDLPDRPNLSMPSHISDSINHVVIRSLPQLSPDELKVILTQKRADGEISSTFLSSLLCELNLIGE